MKILKICLKQSFLYSKWVLQAILSLSNCVSITPNFDNAFLPDCTNFFLCFFRLLIIKCNKHSKNMLKTVIFILQVGFTGDLSFQTVFLSVQTLRPLFSLTIPNFECFFGLLNRKFNEEFKNLPKTVIFILWVSFTSDLIFFKLCFCQFKLCNTVLPDCTKLFFCVFLGYWIANLMRIPKMCLKL